MQKGTVNFTGTVMLFGMADRFQSIIIKMTRSREHFDSLLPLVDAYFDSCRDNATRPLVPARIGLICGDCLQNLRSVLDYLVYELVLANGQVPNRKHMFPIAMDAGQYERDLPHKLKGVDPIAIAFIDAIQPYLLAEPRASPLYVLDELTNLNKHRRPILTILSAIDKELPFVFPHMNAIVKRPIAGTEAFQETPLKVWLSFSEDAAKDIEIVSLLNTLAMYVGDEVLPLFQRFLR